MVLNLYEHFCTQHALCQELLVDDERSEDEKQNFLELSTMFIQFKTRVEQLVSLQSETVPKQNSDHVSLNPDDSASQMKSFLGSRTGGSYISDARARDMRRRAEFEVRVRAIEQQCKLEHEHLKIQEAVSNMKLKADEFKIKTELEVVKAQGKALEDFELAKSDITRNASNTSFLLQTRSNYPPNVALDHKPNFPSNLNPEAPDWKSNYSAPKGLSIAKTVVSEPAPPEPTVANSVDVNLGILALSHELRKPIPEIKPFSGNVIEYTSFMRQFNARVNATTSSFDERLNYLLQFTTGEAYKIVLGYSHLNAEMGFNAALAEFKERYGDPDVIAYEYVKRALDWPQIKSDNSKGLHEFGIFLRECQFAVENVEAARVLEYSDNLKLLMKKLPFFLQEKWRNIVFETKRKGYVIKFSQ